MICCGVGEGVTMPERGGGGHGVCRRAGGGPLRGACHTESRVATGPVRVMGATRKGGGGEPATKNRNTARRKGWCAGRGRHPGGALACEPSKRL